MKNKFSSRRITELDPGRVFPLEIKVEGPSREDFEHAFRKFKALFQKERIVGQLKEKMAYEKPSARKRRKAREAVERRLQADYKTKLMQTGEWDRKQKSKMKGKLQKQERRAQETFSDE